MLCLSKYVSEIFTLSRAYVTLNIYVAFALCAIAFQSPLQIDGRQCQEELGQFFYESFCYVVVCSGARPTNGTDFDRIRNSIKI